jgi:hypothetical protein
MTLDASGNLGIGTSTPSSFGKLAILSTGTSTTVALVNSSSSSASNTVSTDYFLPNSFGGLEKSATIGAINPNAGGNNGGVLYFSTSSNGTATTPTERARITAACDLLVGVTTALRSGDRFSASGSGSQVATFRNDTDTSGYSAISTIIQANGNNTSTYHLWGNTNGVGNWYLYGNGTTSFSSDVRLKKNVVTARDGYIDDICKLRVVKYNWKKDADETPKELGLIAQEVEQVFPALVQDDLNPIEEGGEIYKQVKQSVLPFMLLKAIQEQQAIITQLTARVAQLETK